MHAMCDCITPIHVIENSDHKKQKNDDNLISFLMKLVDT